MQFPTPSSPHVVSSAAVQKLMFEVMIALVPGTIAMIWFFGFGVLVNILLAIGTGLAVEALSLKLRDRPMQPYISDGSIIVTGWLLGLALPTLAPWWLTVIGALVAAGVGKHLYGGLGNNPFNPAMVGYITLLISFPVEMTTWLGPYPHYATLDIGSVLSYTFTGVLPAGLALDAFTAATPLDSVKTGLSMNMMITEIRASGLFGDFGGAGWEWIGNWFLLGGLYLLYRKVITWHIPVAMLGALIACAAIMYPLDPETQPFPLFHMFAGGAILGAFFIATDPASTCASYKGKLIFGAGVGILVYVIRTWGGYPDGVAFAVLLMNLAAPTIDYYTKPPAFGQVKDEDA